tara:strand:+ start:9134 stop:9718 length:585 start_codon:yes stop_codon:yes gene_type:complete
MAKILFIASSNLGKIKEFQSLLSHLNCDIRMQPNNINIEETGKTFADNSRIKARYISKITKSYAIADDSGLCVNCLKGRPGVFSSRYAENDELRIKRILREMLDSVNRSAFFVANISIASPSGEIIGQVEAKCEGKITTYPKGDNGFGYDPIFQVKGTSLTYAEMDLETKKNYSHRNKALKKILPILDSIFGGV